MQKPTTNCLGCRTFFEQLQALPLECMTVQYKNFPLPIVEHKHRWSLLKTIVSFLNTKGGTIYIGVEDSNCKVLGKQLPSKLRDEFKLYLLTLVEKIVPQVDLNVKEEVCVQYVPVLKNKAFSGKYVTKILVQQGDPSQTYCFTQKIQWAPENKRDIEGQCENIEVVYGFVRHNMGGAREVKGMKLVEEAIKKAQNPSPKFMTFHEECNPEPSSLQVEIKKIGFRNLGNREARRKFEKIFRANLEKLQSKFEIVYDTEIRAVVIDFPTVEEFRRVNKFISANLSFLNESQGDVRFVEVGEYLGVHFYQNTNKNVEQEGSSPVKERTSSQSKQNGQNNYRKKSEEEKPDQRAEHKQEKKAFERKMVDSKFSHQNNEITKSQTSNEQQTYSLTFTHINPHISEKLINYLTMSVSKKIHLQTEAYYNTIEVFFTSLDDLQRYSTICMQASHLKALQTFGFNNEIRIGLNTSHLHILNYDKSKEQKLLNFLKSLMGKDLKQLEVLKRGNRYIVDCRMTGKNRACEWLDKLLVHKPLKDFKIPGAQNGSAPKMKVFIHCEEIKP